ncbi:Uncharacterised protein [Vibrio cholerae]|nr:Uncharacterised protein [Vibrio cholerae]
MFRNKHGRQYHQASNEGDTSINQSHLCCSFRQICFFVEV